ncbi:IS5/IS1182 family transposase domain protein [Rickettsiales endosymbiont of Paramecium tredecaurelia]|nr:IS5/IS1182 family transposase domain protein [Candidatus Sarmatiella mevalonica]
MIFLVRNVGTRLRLKSYHGKVHDFKIHKQKDRLPIDTNIYADSGYQGLKKLCKNVKTPIKTRRKKLLSYWQKIYNKIIVKRRIKVENIIAQLKNFRILSNCYRNKRKAINFKNGFYNKALVA